jgi:ribonuclease Z
VELYFLGTGAGMPSRQRNVTSIALNLLPERGVFWLFECGEGTQHQILQAPIKLSKTEKLFVTHLHGDHLYGIPGLLSSRSYLGGESPLTVYGPRGIAAYIRHSLEVSGSKLAYELKVEELDGEGIVFEDDFFVVEACRLDHKPECFGYRVMEKDLPGPLLIDKLQAEGIASGPLYGRIKSGGLVELPDGRTIRGEDYVGESIRGRIVTILGDTKPCGSIRPLALSADVLVHEATFGGDKSKLAAAYGHSTAADAARAAQEAGVRTLILTHISSRYQDSGADVLLAEARDIHPDTRLAEDFWSFVVERQ